jgi:hypothetical protein
MTISEQETTTDTQIRLFSHNTWKPVQENYRIMKKNNGSYNWYSFLLNRYRATKLKTNKIAFEKNAMPPH